MGLHRGGILAHPLAERSPCSPRREEDESFTRHGHTWLNDWEKTVKAFRHAQIPVDGFLVHSTSNLLMPTLYTNITSHVGNATRPFALHLPICSVSFLVRLLGRPPPASLCLAWKFIRSEWTVSGLGGNVAGHHDY